MIRKNCNRSGCVDVFRAFLVENADFRGDLDIPSMRPEDTLPNRLIPFSKAISAKDHDQWVHFFEDDVKFERVWRAPKRYLPILNRFNGVISPDFSMYRDMPLVEQQWNLYRSRALAQWLQLNGVRVIPNIRFGDHRTVEISCLGVPRRSVIAFGSHGNLKSSLDFDIFSEGVSRAIRILDPKAIVVYGPAPDSIFGFAKNRGVEVLSFPTEFSKSRNKDVI